MTPAQADLMPVSWARLLSPDAREGQQGDLSRHLQTRGLLPTLNAAEVIAAVREAGLTGRGGAGFPTHRKLTAVAAGRNAVVVANGAESEPASAKDKLLMTAAPHLVLDGLQLAARAVGAREAFCYVHAGLLVARMQALATARAARGIDAIQVQVVEAPVRFVAGQETAVVSRLSGGSPLPRAVPPPAYQKGVRGRPTLVQNVETLAHLALIARYGPDWFRALGTPDEPGTMLFTVSGAVWSPGVVEAPLGTPIRDVLALAGGPRAEIQAVLVGGYHGTWLSAFEAAELPVSVAALQPVNALPGAGVLIALPAASCGVIETTRAISYLADQSSGQCGPCLNGLPALAATWQRLAGTTPAGGATARIAQLGALVQRRGVCHHPDGTAGFMNSALRVFAGETRAHEYGRCTRTDATPVLPVPTVSPVPSAKGGSR